MNEKLSKDYPSLETAFPIAVASYEQMHKRIDAIDAKNQQVTAFGVTLFLAIPALFKSSLNTNFSILFILSIMCLICAVVISLYSRYVGTIKVISPQSLYETSLHLSPAEFQRDIIYFAGEAFQTNSALLDQKWKLNLLSNLLLLIGLITLLVWASGSHS